MFPKEVKKAFRESEGYEDWPKDQKEVIENQLGTLIGLAIFIVLCAIAYKGQLHSLLNYQLHF